MTFSPSRPPVQAVRRLLTSKQASGTDTGPCCLQKMRQEEAERKMAENQYSLLMGWRIQRRNNHEPA